MNIFKSTVATIALLATATTAYAGEDEAKTWNVSSGLFLHLDGATESDPNLFRRVRARGEATNKNGWGVFAEVDLAKTELINDSTGNWVERFHVFAEINDSTRVLAGRCFLAGQLNTPPPFRLKTVNYFNNPYSPFAYCAQVSHKIGNGWNVVADVSGKSGLSFDDSDQFDRIESSGRLSRKASSDVSYGFGWHVSEDFVRTSADLKLNSNNWELSTGAFYSQEDNNQSDGFSVFAQTEAFTDKNVRPVFRADLGTDGDVDLTAGVGVYFNNNVRVLFNYEERNDQDQFLVRLETAFGNYAR